MEDDLDTEALLSAAGRNDQEAWDALVARYSGLLWAIARSFRLDTADAADVVQATWLRLVENLGRIVEPARLAAWLATTVRRECLQAIRREGRTRVVHHLDAGDDVVDPAPPVEEIVLTDERDTALWRVFGTLSDRCQRLLRVLMASPPPAYAEVAEALDMAIGSIGPTRKRCLEHLRETVRHDELLGSEEHP
jgi:RNA polymerase sigma factor (sigma-70 family)